LAGAAETYKDVYVLGKDFVREDGFTRVPVHVDTGKLVYPDAWPVSGGVPLPKGALTDSARTRLLDSQMKAVSFQARPLAYWDDKSVKWLELEFKIKGGEASPVYYLEFGKSVPQRKAEDVKVTETDKGFEIDTGALRAFVSKKEASIMESAEVTGDKVSWRALKKPVSSYMKIRDIESGKSGSYSSLNDKAPSVSIERKGAESVTFLIRGRHVREDGEKSFPFDTRLTFFKDSRAVKVFHTVFFSENPAVTVYPELGLDIPLDFGGEISAGIDGADKIIAEKNFSLWQDSKEVPSYKEFNQYKPSCGIYKDSLRGKQIFEGKHADGWIRVAGDGKAATVTLRRMTEEFPKAFKVTGGDDLKAEFWPSVKPDPMDLRRLDQRFPEDYAEFRRLESAKTRGYEYNMDVYHRAMSKEVEYTRSAFNKAKSHELWLDFSPAKTPASQLAAAVKRPLLPFVSPAWNSLTKAMGVFHPEDYANFPKIEKGWELAWDTLRKHQTEWFNWYGMFCWGDFQTNYIPSEKRWENYNTKYSWRNGGMDIPYSLFMWYMRSGKRKYFDMVEAESLHLADVCSSHPRAWEDESVFPKDWKGAGTSRYDSSHWGSGAGYDPQHLFCHSVQMLWLSTGNNYAKDNVMSYALNYYNRDKPFTYKKYLGQDLHYHGRESDMPSRLAGNAFENEPDDPRWNEMLDFYLATQAESFGSMFTDKSGAAFRRCNNQSVDTFYYTLYTVPALNYLLTVKDYPPLVDACGKGVPARRNDESGGGLSYYLLYLMTGNKNYAKFAGRQACTYAAYVKLDDKRVPDINAMLIPHVMGGTWSAYPGLLAAAVTACGDLSPEKYDDRELNYYPLAEPGPQNPRPGAENFFMPLDIRSVCNWNSGSDSGEPENTAEKPNDNLGKGPVVFDFGPAFRAAPGCVPVDSSTFYPSNTFVRRGFSELPFGSSARFAGVTFALPPCGGKNTLVIRDEKSYNIPAGVKADKIYLLTGPALSEDPFHEGAGAVAEVKYKDGSKESFPLENMRHYQFKDFRRLYFDRAYYAGKQNSFVAGVVPLDTKGRDVESLTLSGAGKNANLCVFAVTAKTAAPEKSAAVLDKTVNLSGKDKVVFKTSLPDGLYTAALTCSMKDPIGSPLDIMAQGKIVVSHTVPTAKTTYEIPVEVTGGSLEIELVPGEIQHKTRSAEGEITLESVRISKLDKAGIIPTVKRDGGKKPLTFGWRLRGRRAVLHDTVAVTDKKAPGIDSRDSLLNWDASYIDKDGVGKAEFIADIPNGVYDLDLVLLNSWAGMKEISVPVEIEGKTFNASLPLFKRPSFGVYIPEYKPLKQRVTVSDGQLNITISLPPPGKRNVFDACGAASLTIKPVKEEASP
jgi:hypothetical protein